MNQKRGDGRETWDRLLRWDKGKTPAERLSCQILLIDGFKKVDPIHPLGGPDGKKDLIAFKEEKKWVVAVYFPRDQQSITEIRNKFIDDFKGVAKNDADGFVFFTNQEVRDAERGMLIKTCDGTPVDIYHLERIRGLLDGASAYGVRLEFLGIAMSKEEQLSYFDWISLRNKAAIRDALQVELQLLNDELLSRARVILGNHSIIIFPIFELYRTIVWYITTPYSKRGGSNNSRIYNPNFDLSDLQDMFEPSFLSRFPMYEPTINRYLLIQRQLRDEMASMVKLVDHTGWPTLPQLCVTVLRVFAEYDYSEAFLGNEKMYAGPTSLRDRDVEYLKEHPDDMQMRPGNLINAYRALALEIKGVMPLIDQIQKLIVENRQFTS